MPNVTASESVEEFAGDLRIDVFDQMHNSADLRLWPSNWAAPVEPDVS